MPTNSQGKYITVGQNIDSLITQGKTLEVDKDTLLLHSQSKSLEVEQLTHWSEPMGEQPKGIFKCHKLYPKIRACQTHDPTTLWSI